MVNIINGNGFIAHLNAALANIARVFPELELYARRFTLKYSLLVHPRNILIAHSFLVDQIINDGNGNFVRKSMEFSGSPLWHEQLLKALVHQYCFYLDKVLDDSRSTTLSGCDSISLDYQKFQFLEGIYDLHRLRIQTYDKTYPVYNAISRLELKYDRMYPQNSHLTVFNSQASAMGPTGITIAAHIQSYISANPENRLSLMRDAEIKLGTLAKLNDDFKLYNLPFVHEIQEDPILLGDCFVQTDNAGIIKQILRIIGESPSIEHSIAFSLAFYINLCYSRPVDDYLNVLPTFAPGNRRLATNEQLSVDWVAGRGMYTFNYIDDNFIERYKPKIAQVITGFPITIGGTVLLGYLPLQTKQSPIPPSPDGDDSSGGKWGGNDGNPENPTPPSDPDINAGGPQLYEVDENPDGTRTVKVAPPDSAPGEQKPSLYQRVVKTISGHPGTTATIIGAVAATGNAVSNYRTGKNVEKLTQLVEAPRSLVGIDMSGKPFVGLDTIAAPTDALKPPRQIFIEKSSGSSKNVASKLKNSIGNLINKGRKRPNKSKTSSKGLK